MGNILAIHPAGLGSIPGLVSFLVEVFPRSCKMNVRKFRPHFPQIIFVYHNHPTQSLIHLEMVMISGLRCNTWPSLSKIIIKKKLLTFLWQMDFTKHTNSIGKCFCCTIWGFRIVNLINTVRELYQFVFSSALKMWPFNMFYIFEWYTGNVQV